MVRSNKVLKIISLLEREYGTENFVYYDNPLNQLILTILSQNTNWQNCRRSFTNLKQRFKSWEEVMVSNVNQIATTIKSGGLGKIKAKRIHSFLKTFWKMKGSLDLSFLCDIDSGEGLAFLNSFKGIGPKTAACVLLFSCKKPILPVDTHIFRVSKRLGLIGVNVNFVHAHKLLGQVVPSDKVLSFHTNAIRHGRKICRARKPRCLLCVLRHTCEFWKTNTKKKRYLAKQKV